ncbi:MAG: hypothetical protein LUC30_00260 [Clostridiales bacterium]|nr:hypothetical protein [Clostridiales bacterium]
MENNIPRILIEITARRAIRELKRTPRRGIRNMVDLALNFCRGRFQRAFFESAQRMLQNEQSAYYELVYDLVNRVDTDRLLTFGMNLGYNSCTSGAKTIRALEASEGYNIPWLASVILSGDQYLEREDDYCSLIDQGRKLGIYSWQLFSRGNASELLALPRKYPDCAFALFCAPEEWDETLTEEAAALYNLLPVVRHEDGVEEVCRRMRDRGLFYAVYVPYGPEELADVQSGELFACTEPLGAAFTMLMPKEGCPEETRREVYDATVRARQGQRYRTIPWDIMGDSCMVDSIISEDECLAVFASSGDLILPEGAETGESLNLFRMPLTEILRAAYPKEKA